MFDEGVEENPGTCIFGLLWGMVILPHYIIISSSWPGQGAPGGRAGEAEAQLLYDFPLKMLTPQRPPMIRSREWKLCRSFLFLNQQSFHSPDLNGPNSVPTQWSQLGPNSVPAQWSQLDGPSSGPNSVVLPPGYIFRRGVLEGVSSRRNFPVDFS